MRTVLVPYDGSDAAARALQHVLRLPLVQRPHRIHVLNVQGEPMFHGQILTHGDAQGMHEAQLSHGRHILRPAEEQLLTAGADFRSHVVVGQPEHVIVAMARELECDQIVMGTRGMGTIKTLLIGSVALKTAHLADIPVTLVK
jgi:nucleotide-binding universal stress UspA family protein